MLKKKLYNLIQQKGFVKLEELHALAEELGYKQSNCERRLRELEQKNKIDKVINDKKFIIGYKYKNSIMDELRKEMLNRQKLIIQERLI